MFSQSELKRIFCLLKASYSRSSHRDLYGEHLYVRIGDYMFFYDLLNNQVFYSCMDFPTEYDWDHLCFCLALEVFERHEQTGNLLQVSDRLGNGFDILDYIEKERKRGAPAWKKRSYFTNKRGTIG